jgi:hypothetical protein
MGEIFWDSVPGVTRIESWVDLRAAMRTPVAEMERVAPEDARRFVAGLAEFSLPGRPFASASLDDEDNLALVRDAIAIGAGIEAPLRESRTGTR